VTYNHVVSEAIKGCCGIAKFLRERMVEKRVKYILVLLKQFCDDILLGLRFRRRRTSRRGWWCSGRRRMCRHRSVYRLRRWRLRGKLILP
jgi:hypothetical protein